MLRKHSNINKTCIDIARDGTNARVSILKMIRKEKWTHVYLSPGAYLELFSTNYDIDGLYTLHACGFDLIDKFSSCECHIGIDPYLLYSLSTYYVIFASD